MANDADHTSHDTNDTTPSAQREHLLTGAFGAPIERVEAHRASFYGQNSVRVVTPIPAAS